MCLEWIRFVELNTIAESACLDFVLGGSQDAGAEEAVEGFIVRWKGEIRAYVNSCPHTGASLNWSANEYFDLEHQFLQCGIHGALFHPLTGLCVHGPCLAQSLTEWPLKIEQDVVFLQSNRSK